MDWRQGGRRRIVKKVWDLEGNSGDKREEMEKLSTNESLETGHTHTHAEFNHSLLSLSTSAFS